MDYYVDIIEINICIICNSDEGVVNILADTLEGESVLLHEALEFITCLKVETDDSISKTLCEACNGRLLDAYRFKNQALESYKALQDISAPAVVKNVNEHDVKLQSNPLVPDAIDPIPKLATALTRSTVKPEIDMSTDAVSFLIEHHLSNNTKDKAQVEQQQIIPPPGPKGKKNGTKDKIPKVKLKRDCKVCGKLFPKKSNLIDHMRLHANEKKFACSYCDKSFVQIANFRMHERIHTKERPYVCPICSKAYTQSSTLTIHMRSHTEERDYICSICNKTFTNSSDLNKHKRVHDPSKHLKCEFCGKFFVQKINMKVHQKNVHGKESSSLFVCK